jgi:hypothetical protein
MRYSPILAVAVLLSSWTVATAVPPPNIVNRGGAVIPRRPAVSPYLALTNRGVYGGVANYYTFIRPYQAQQQWNMQQGAALMRLEQQIQNPQNPQNVFGGAAGAPPLTSGYPAWFMNHSRYFGGGTLSGAVR